MSDELKGRLRDYALRIICLYTSLPKSSVGQVLGRQVLKSGTSVGAQHREAHRARSTAEFISKMESALQELDETDYWLDLLGASNTVEDSNIASLVTETDELIRIFTASVKTAKSRGK